MHLTKVKKLSAKDIKGSYTELKANDPSLEETSSRAVMSKAIAAHCLTIFFWKVIGQDLPPNM